uniref:Fibronectin type-III domain-containing protein n=1 Tax=Strongyloides venezuelensis TaxID=75913 RepID=A0A0K0FJJ9_STRVS
MEDPFEQDVSQLEDEQVNNDIVQEVTPGTPLDENKNEVIEISKIDIQNDEFEVVTEDEEFEEKIAVEKKVDIEETVGEVNKNIEVQNIEIKIENKEEKEESFDESEDKEMNDEEKTEDQVPDITATDGGDPMTTSMDGIDDIPEEENKMPAEGGPPGDDTQVVVDDNNIVPTTPCEDIKDVQAEEVKEEVAPTDEEKQEKVVEDKPAEAVEEKVKEVTDEAKIVEEPIEVIERKTDEVVEEVAAEVTEDKVETEEKVAEEVTEEKKEGVIEELVKEIAGEKEVEAVEEVKEEVSLNVSEEKQPDSSVAPSDHEFELQPPPTPKRKQTPCDLDNLAVDQEQELPKVEVDGTTETTEVDTSRKESIPVTPSKKDSVPATPLGDLSKKESLPPTPSKKDSVPATPLDELSRKESLPPTPSKKDSVPATPVIEESAKESIIEEVAREESIKEEIPATPVTEESLKESVPPTPAEESVKESVSEAPVNESINEEPSVATPKVSVISPATPKASITTPKTPSTPKRSISKSGATPKSKKSTSKFNFDDETEQSKKDSVSGTPKSAKTSVSGTPNEIPLEEKINEEHKVPEATIPEETAQEAHTEVEEVKESVEEEVQAEEPAQDESTVNEAETKDVTEEESKADETHVEEPKVEESEQARKVSYREPEVEVQDAPLNITSQRDTSPSEKDSREPPARNYQPYDQDSHRVTGPTKLQSNSSFTSWMPTESASYTPRAPYVVDTAHKYKTDYISSYRPPSSFYTTMFDDIVSTGPFSSSLYATNRLLERSRSRTRERNSALRSIRSASNYSRYISSAPTPMRTREYSTPPSRELSRAPSRAGSFVSFMEYSGAKQYELARDNSRSNIYNSLYRSASRGDVDLYAGSGRLSRVDSYVSKMNHNYDYETPRTYSLYRSTSRPNISYTPSYASYNPSYADNDSTLSRMKRYARETVNPTGYRSMYEYKLQGYVGELERSLSREKFKNDRLRSNYTKVSHQLEQACKQMDLLRTNSYSLCRSGSAPRCSIYSHFYPYY